MAFTHILITRPRAEGSELAELLSSHPAKILTLPAYEFRACQPFPDLVTLLGQSGSGASRPLVVFTSPRSVELGVPQLPEGVLSGCQVAAIGPTTARMLEESGVAVALKAEQGHTSEDLLEIIPERTSDDTTRPADAFIVTAPGGRDALADGLRQRGYGPHLLLVYERKPAHLDPATIELLAEADSVLSVWTSADTVHSLSQRLPGDCWKRLCAGEWVVISERLARVARSFHPARVHLAASPTNADLADVIHALG